MWDRRTFVRNQSLGLFALSQLRCGATTEDLKGFGLPFIKLHISSSDISDMRDEFGAKVRRNALLSLNGQDVGLCEIRFSGQASLYSAKKSFSVKLLDKKSALFDLEKFRISSSSGDLSICRSWLGFEIFSFLNFLTPKMEAVSAYWSGEFQGLFLIIEEIDEDFFKHKDVEVFLFYQAKSGSNFSTREESEIKKLFDAEHESGDYRALIELHKLVAQGSVTSMVTDLENVLSLESAARFFAGNSFLHHWDSMANNFYLYNSKADKRLHYLPWDLDKIVNFDRAYSLDQPNDLFGKLLQNPNFFERTRVEVQRLHAAYPLARVKEFLWEKMNRQKEAWLRDRLSAISGVSPEQAVNQIVDVLEPWLAEHRTHFKI